MKIFLLTHERELLRASNTGALAASLAPEIVERIIWARNSPDPALLDAIHSENTVLLYPADDAAEPIESFENIILLDATWQEARKMFNKSPYLKNLPKAQFKTRTISRYKLRRNQPDGGLCTAECVIEILKSKNHTNAAQRLEAEFAIFNSKITHT
ncbi:DTW domain-containing protein [Cellvibrio sp. KY-GH-1]|uniref:tRNA-uridine aminocarboxypropyltransferase n=1 Tax=Cellvibrio sp. KY-GH-1 TaxID=2303332 RepID=UPI001245EFB6|nr:tRNA-uridine aminocarboxypropyltransferase [Cellvibrio sp. KY-GH-1]QEY17447.1 DTW domain-containing protein [Cellvibrio sp. KY-GH-1]